MASLPTLRSANPRSQQLALEACLARPDHRTKLSAEHRGCLRSYGVDPDSNEIRIELSSNAELRALSALVGASGGFTVKESSFIRQWEDELGAIPMRAASSVTRVDDGGVYREPLVSDFASAGTIQNENTNPGSETVTFAVLLHTPTKFSSGLTLVPYELEQDSPNFSQQLAKVLGYRLARLQNTAFTTGTGAGQPIGIVPACVQNGATLTAISSTAVSGDDILGLYDTIGDAYFGPGCAFQMHRNTYTAIKKLKDGMGRYLFSTDNGTLDGFPVYFNRDMASTIASGTQSVLFGRFAYYSVVDFRELRLVRFPESHAETDSVLWAAYMRSSANLLDAGSHPVVCLTH